ncbi:peroxide stress protein YaaA [Undibacterium sp. TJN25]|uniref:peroxide stress protein YaaA n=1 Tax=Undibacterium sp. TJN25 TaxID=3413056 RepID=UPI003BEFCCB2
MLIVLSPAKSLDYETPARSRTHSLPVFMQDAEQLIQVSRTLSVERIAELMAISPALAQLNAERFAAWSPEATKENARQAVFAFNGDVYEGLDARKLDASQIAYLEKHLRILSGLYGLLRPLDLLQPYRLEMGTRLPNPRGANLYAFWGEKVTDALNEQLVQQRSKLLLNLASEEYFKVVKPALLQAPVVSPVFLDWKNGQYKVISFYAKRARGLMARYCAVNKIRKPEDIKGFDVEGYRFDAAESGQDSWVFKRRIAD